MEKEFPLLISDVFFEWNSRVLKGDKLFRIGLRQFEFQCDVVQQRISPCKYRRFRRQHRLRVSPFPKRFPFRLRCSPHAYPFHHRLRLLSRLQDKQFQQPIPSRAQDFQLTHHYLEW